MTQQPAEEFLCYRCDPRGVLRKVVRVDEQAGVTYLECGHESRQITRAMNEPPTLVSDRMSAIWQSHGYFKRNLERIVLMLTFLLGFVAAYLFYMFLNFLQFAFSLEPLTLLGVLITAIVAIGGAYTYAKSRLDKLIAQLDEIRTWLLYPSLRTMPLRAYTKFDDLQGIARYTVDKLAEARAGVAGRLIISGPVPLVIEKEKENVDVIREIDNMMTLLHGFSVSKFTSAEELTKQWETIFDKTEWLYKALTDLEDRYYKMRRWLPRWLTNLYGKVWN